MKIHSFHIKGELTPPRCAELASEILDLRDPDQSLVLDFTSSQLTPTAWTGLQRVLSRSVARTPGDLWIVGLQSPPEAASWNHAPSVAHIEKLIQSPPLALAALSRWIEARTQEINQLSKTLPPPASRDPKPARQRLSRLRRRKNQLERHIQLSQQRAAQAETAIGNSLTLARLESTVLTALASQGVKLPQNAPEGAPEGLN